MVESENPKRYSGRFPLCESMRVPSALIAYFHEFK